MARGCQERWFIKWAVAATFFSSDGGNRWLDDFVSDAHSFEKVVPRADADLDGWHTRRSRGTPLHGWLTLVNTAWRTRHQPGVITVFPPLAILVGLFDRLRGADRPHVAYCFNLGSMPGGPRRWAARVAMKRVDIIIVHSRAEIRTVSVYLALPAARVRFIPLHRASMPVPLPPCSDEPFILAMGSANRDYATLFRAAEHLP